MTYKPGDVVWVRAKIESVSPEDHMAVVSPIEGLGLQLWDVGVSTLWPGEHAGDKAAKVREELRAIVANEELGRPHLEAHLRRVLNDDSKWPKGGGE